MSKKETKNDKTPKAKMTATCTIPDIPEDIIERTITLRSSDWDGHAYGVHVGRITEDGTILSNFRSDREGNRTERFDRLRNGYPLVEKHVRYVDDDADKLRSAVDYYVPYEIDGHCSKQPTVTDTFVEAVSNVQYDVTWEILLVSGENYRRYVTQSYTTKGSYASCFFDQVREIEEMIGGWIEEGENDFRKDPYGSLEVAFYNDVGEKTFIEFCNVEEILQTIASIRVIKCDITIIEP